MTNGLHAGSLIGHPFISFPHKGGGQEKRFSLGTYDVGFILPAMGDSFPYFSMLCWLGPITLLIGIGLPIFSQISLILVDSHVYPIFPVFVLFTPIFAVFLFRATYGTHVMALSLRGSGLGTQLPNWSLAKTFLLVPSLFCLVPPRSAFSHCFPLFLVMTSF